MTRTNPFSDPARYSGRVWSACNAAGLTKNETQQILLDQALADGGVDAALARVDTISQIKSLCAFADASDVALDLIDARLSLQEARVILMNARAAASDALDIYSHPPSDQSAAAVADRTIWRQRRGPQ